MRLRHRGADFVLHAAAWNVGLAAALRLPWVDAHVVAPLAGLQARGAGVGAGLAAVPFAVTSSCANVDAAALCAGVVLAYPVSWRHRAIGVAGALGCALILNVARLASLAGAGARAFQLLHVVIWPVTIAGAMSIYVLAWMLWADGAATPIRQFSRTPFGRFALTAMVLSALFLGAAPLYLHSGAVLMAARFVASVAACVLRLGGNDAIASGSTLWTGGTAIVVTQECIATPLLPVAAAAVLTCPASRLRRFAALCALVPACLLLGSMRLLLVAVPRWLTRTPLDAVHAFFEVLTAAAVICGAAWLYPRGPRSPFRRAAVGLGVAAAAGWILMRIAFADLLRAGPAVSDPQAALALMPAFQLAIFAGICAAASGVMRARAIAVGTALLVAQAALFLSAVDALVRMYGLAPHVRDVRAWSIAAPVAVAFLLARRRPWSAGMHV